MSATPADQSATQKSVPQTRSRRWHDKEAQILAAAEGMFMARGYAGASMDAIAQQAGVSKQTLYHHHGSKESLFGAIVGARIDRLLLSLEADDLSGPPREALTHLGRAILEVAVSPSSIALHRAVVTEAPRQPELGRTILAHGPDRAERALAGYLREQTRRGRLQVDAPERAAEQFYGLTLGHMQLRALLDVDARPDADAIAAAVDSAVEVFLRAYGV